MREIREMEHVDLVRIQIPGEGTMVEARVEE